MNHTEIQEQLFSYYDGELSPAARSLVEVHLEVCAPCRDVLEGWKQTSARFLQPLEGQSSEVFVQQVMRKVRLIGTESEGLRWPVFIRWAYPALALSAAGFAAALFLVQSPAVVSTETLLSGGQSSTLVSQWLSNPPTEDQILSSMVTQ